MGAGSGISATSPGCASVIVMGTPVEGRGSVFTRMRIFRRLPFSALVFLTAFFTSFWRGIQVFLCEERLLTSRENELIAATAALEGNILERHNFYFPVVLRPNKRGKLALNAIGFRVRNLTIGRFLVKYTVDHIQFHT